MRMLLCIIVCGALGCQQVGLTDVEERAHFKSQILETDTPIKVGLVQLRDVLPTASYEDLLARNVVVERGEIGGSVQLDARFRNLLLATAGYRVDQVGSGAVRVQRFKLNQDFVPLRLLGDSVDAILPFKLRAGAEVEFARAFDSESAAHSAPTFSLLDLPHNATSALALPIGTIVTIPVEANVSVDIGGQFFSQAANAGHTFARQLQLSASGSASSVRRGTLVGQGQFRLQVIRLNEQQVRVRLLSGLEGSVNANVAVSTAAFAQYTFLPAAHVDRVRAFRRGIERGRRFIDEIRNIPQRVEALRDVVPNTVQSLIDTTSLPLSEAADARIDSIVNGVDEALLQAERMTSHIDTLDDMVGQRVSELLERTSSAWDGHIEPVIDRIQRLSSRLYALNQSVRLSDGLSRRLRLMGDYWFDLDSEEARIAFDRAISGRAVWRGAQTNLLGPSLDLDTDIFADFTLADDLAESDLYADAPRVKRLALGGSDLSQRQFSVAVQGLGMSLGFDGSFARNRVELIDESGIRQAFQSRVWERGTRSTFFGAVRSELFASGAFTKTDNDEVRRGGYWFRWHKVFPDAAATPVGDALAHVLNDLGPVAINEGVAALYQGEYPGTVRAELFVQLNDSAMTAIFDPARASEGQLWAALEKMMSRYEKPAALPFAIAPIRPGELEHIPGASAACESVAEVLGGRYCYSFAHRIFPALLKAQIEQTAESRLDFFESFYRVPLGGATLSTRVLVRYLAELSIALGVDDPFTISLGITNDSDDSRAASPRLMRGDAKALSLSQSTALGPPLTEFDLD